LFSEVVGIDNARCSRILVLRGARRCNFSKVQRLWKSCLREVILLVGAMHQRG